MESFGNIEEANMVKTKLPLFVFQLGLLVYFVPLFVC